IRALKARIAPAEIAFWIFIRALHCAGKESPAQRAERNEADAEMTQQRDDARLEVALPQRILALQCRYRVHGMSAPYGLLTRFRKSEKANLAGVHEISHRADDVLDRDRRIDAVLVQQVYMICLQTTERALHGFANVQRPAVQATLLARFPDAPPELGRDRRLIPLSLERAAEQFLVGERPVHLGGIQKRDADLERPVQCRDRLAFVTLFRRSIRCGHPHASEPDGGDGEALGAELSLSDHACGSSFVYDDDVSSIRNKDAWSRGWKWRAPAWRRAYTKVAPKLRCCVRAATRRRASPGPADDPYLAAASATAEELVSAIGLESRNARSGRHVESLEHLSCVDIDVPQIAVLAFPRGMPEFAVHPGDASDKAVGFDRPKNGARLRIDLMDLPVAMLPHP